MMLFTRSKQRLSEIALFFMVVPFNIGQWTPVHVNTHPMPVVTEEKSTWKIVSRDGAGGYAFIFKEAFDKDQLIQASWDWKVTRFPNVEIRLPFSKQNDDFALRVGFLISGGSTSITIPDSIEKLFGTEKKKISNIIFYQAIRSTKGNQEACGESPYQKGITYCLRFANTEFETLKVKPTSDLIKNQKPNLPNNLKVVGLWIFSDSDNSHSESEAYLKNLKMEEGI